MGQASFADRLQRYEKSHVRRNSEPVNSSPEALLREKIPYTLYSGVQFFDRMEIKDALSYLRMIAYQDDLAFRRIANVPKRNLGKRRMAFLEETARKQGEVLLRCLQVSGTPGRWGKRPKVCGSWKIFTEYRKMS